MQSCWVNELKPRDYQQGNAEFLLKDLPVPSCIAVLYGASKVAMMPIEGIILWD